MKKILFLLLISLFVMAVTACGTDPTPTPAPTAVPTDPPTAVPQQPTAAPPTAEPTTEPTAVPTQAPQMLSVTGEITYTDDITLPDDAIVIVQIQDISQADAQAKVIGEQSYVTAGQQEPLPFTVPYNTADIQENLTYGLSVRITAADDTLLFINDTAILVITQGNPSSDIVANVIMVNSPAAAPAENTDSPESVPPIAQVIGRPLQWITFFDARAGEQTIANPTLYQLLLNENGTLSVTADCKTTDGTYTVDGNSINMELGPVTQQICSEESLADRYLGHLTAVRIFFNQDGDVFFDLFADGGTMQFTDVDSTSTPDAAPTDDVSKAAVTLNVQGLADTYSWEVVPAVTPAAESEASGSPAYVVVTFNGATVTETLAANGPRIAIFPVEPYIKAAGDSVADQVALLNELVALADGVTPAPEMIMPLLPPPSSVMDRWVQYLKLPFIQGDGIRYLSDSPDRQQIGVWANDTTGYYYQALTENGRFYISLFWPISTDSLPNTAEEADEGTKATATNTETHAAYQQALRTSLNELSASAWTPNLEELDALAASIEFIP